MRITAECFHQNRNSPYQSAKPPTLLPTSAGYTSNKLQLCIAYVESKQSRLRHI